MTIQNAVVPQAIRAEVHDDGGRRDPGGASLTDILRVLRVQRRVIIGTAVTIVVLAIIIVLQMTPIYTSTATVMLDPRKNNIAETQAVLGDLSNDQSTLQNQVQILTSLQLAGRVVDKLHLENDPELNPRPTPFVLFLKYANPFNWFPGVDSAVAVSDGVDIARSALLRSFLSHLTVTPVGLSTAMTVTYSSQSAAKAARIANAIANAYVEDQLEAKFDATQKATQWLSSRIQDLSRQAQTADAAVQRYKADHNITMTSTGVSVVDQQTADLSSQLILARANLAEKESDYSSLIAMQRAGKAADAARVMSSPMVATLRGQEADINRQLADMTSRYLPSHPKILTLQAQKDTIETKLNEEVLRVIESVHNDMAAASAHAASLQGSLSQMENRGAGQNVDQVQLTALQSAATSARSMYEAFLGRLNQTQNQDGIQAPDARVISPAQVPVSPSTPKKGLSIALAAFGGLALGLLIAFLIERLDAGFRTSAQVELQFDLPVMGVIPEIKHAAGETVNAADLVIDKPLSAFAEALRGLQLGISLSNVDRKPKVIVVTSSVPGEGKTTLALSLGRQAAVGNLRVVVVDGDLRRPNVSKAVGLERSASGGLMEVLSDPTSLTSCLVKDPKSNLLILPCGKTPPSPADTLASNAMTRLVDTLKDAFDLIIIDSAPILPVNDTKIVSRLADAVLFVVRWEKTPREAAGNAMRAMRDVSAPVVGVALTRADTERFRYYNYGYQSYYNYEKYYS